MRARTASLLLAGAYLHLGETQKASELLSDMRNRFPDLFLNGAKASLPDTSDPAALLAGLEKLFGSPAVGQNTLLRQWTMFRGGVGT